MTKTEWETESFTLLCVDQHSEFLDRKFKQKKRKKILIYQDSSLSV